MISKNPGMRPDRDMEIVLGNLLRAGVIAAAVVVLAGGILYLFRHGAQATQYATFHAQPAAAWSLTGISSMIGSIQAQAIMRLGFLLLIATPVLRVAFSVIGFARLRDAKYVVITLIVLIILLYSLFAGQI